MALYTNLPIYKATYTLLLDVTKTMQHVPRDCRYTLGQDLRRKLTELLVLIYQANRTHHKLKTIALMRDTLLEAQVYMRLMSDMHYISEGRYLALAEQTSNMSKQLTAWAKSERARETDSGEPRDGLE